MAEIAAAKNTTGYVRFHLKKGYAYFNIKHIVMVEED